MSNRTSFVTSEMRRQFHEDGVVLLPQVLEPSWLELIAIGIRRNMRNPGPYNMVHYEGTDREFLDDFCNYYTIPEYQMLLRDSPVVDVVADILETENLWMYYDQIFVKQGGRSKRTPWHQDHPYWVTEGQQQCGFWMTLNPVKAEESLEFVRGSHKGPMFAGTDFDANDDTSPFYEDLPRIPDIEADRDKFDIVSFDIEPGDVVMFHPAMLHGGGASEAGRKTLSVRFFGDDVVYRDPGRAVPSYPGRKALLKPGDPLRGSWWPQVLPRPTTPLW